jgi:hypothetical protein
MLIVGVELAVDPAMAKRCVDRLQLGERPLGRALLCQLEPKPESHWALRLEPSVKGASVSERQDWQAGAHLACLQLLLHGSRFVVGRPRQSDAALFSGVRLNLPQAALVLGFTSSV